MALTVLDRKTNPELFDAIQETTNTSLGIPEYDEEEEEEPIVEELREFINLCKDTELDSEKVRNLVEEATHILILRDGGRIVTFAYVDAAPSLGGDYATLILVCGKFRTEGKYPWKGSEIMVDKAMELARVAGKKTLRIEALNQDLIDKVYKPMGFKDIEGRYLEAEISIKGGSRKLRFKKQTRRTKRNTRSHKRNKLRNLATRRR
jgi:hypothetical protein